MLKSNFKRYARKVLPAAAAAVGGAAVLLGLAPDAEGAANGLRFVFRGAGANGL